jgi:hypothetical protein
MIGSDVRVIVGEVIAPAVSDDVVILRELLQLCLPLAVVIQTSMHKYNWNSFATFHVVQLNGIDSYFLKPVLCRSGVILRCCLRGKNCGEHKKDSNR